MLLSTLLFFLIGLFLGSFFGVLVDRLPFGKNIVTDRSRCEFCRHTLSALDLVPVLSFVFLHGKCRYCRKKLPYFYPIIELTTGTVFALTYWYLFKYPISNIQYQIPNLLLEIGSIGNYLKLVFIFYIVSSFIVIFFTDLKYRLIPNAIVYPAVLVTGVFLFINHNSYLLNHIYAAFGALIFFLALFIGTKGKGMGFGDVQLSFLLGLLLGFPKIIVGLYLAFLTGAFISLILILVRKYTLKNSIPFGPFLILGTLIALVWGDTILTWFPYF